MTDFVTKDSGERQDFNSGARRDISHGKTRPDLISAKARQRWGDLMGRGAEKYGARNWELGMPASRFLESAYRHLLNYELGDRDEDHLAAVLFNIGAMIHFEGTEWDDINGETIVDDFFYDLLTSPSHEQPQPTMKALWEQLELPFGDVMSDAELYYQSPSILKDDEPINLGGSMVNWDKLRKDVAEGKLDGDTVNWAPGQAPTE